jgi:hypothetical protein
VQCSGVVEKKNAAESEDDIEEESPVPTFGEAVASFKAV